MITLPTHYHLVYSHQEIQSKVKELGESISKWNDSIKQKSGADLVVLPLLRGGLFFCADLMRAIQGSCELAPCKVSHYDVTTNSRSGSVSVNFPEDLPVRGRSVLVVDDICDSGITLAAVVKKLSELGAFEVKSAVAVFRKIPEIQFTPDYVGFTFDGEDWLVGYGMDDSDRFRNLAGIYRISHGS